MYRKRNSRLKEGNLVGISNRVFIQLHTFMPEKKATQKKWHNQLIFLKNVWCFKKNIFF